MARKMKDSGIEWIGEIPEGWEIRKIKNNFMIYAGATPKSEKAEYWDGGIPWITPADFKTTDKYVSYGRKSLTALGYDSCGTTLVPAGSIIFSKRAPVGSVVIAKNTLCTNQGCLACIPNDAVNSTYFYYCMSIFTEQFELVSAGTTFKEIAASTFASFLLPCPPLSQQNEIVNFLNKESSRIDSMLSKTRSSIEEYKKLKQAVITQAVTKGVRGEREMKDSGVEWIGEIPAEWKIQRFARVAEVKSNLVSPDNYLEYPQISPENIEKDSGKLLLPCRTVSEVGVISGNHLFYKGQILYSKIRPKLNKVCIAPFDGLCSADMYPIESKNDTRYIVYCILSNGFLQQVSMITENRVKMPKVNQVELSKILVAIPETIAEQKEIADYLDAKCAEIDGLIAKKEQLVKELESYKKSLIYEVVTGKREV